MLGNREHHPMTGRAEGAITGSRFVKPGAAVGGIEQCDTAGEFASGVSKFDIASGEVGLYHGDGDVRVTSGEAIALDDDVTTDADGKAKVADTAADNILGKALNAATAADQVVLVRLLRGIQSVPAP